MSTDAFTSETRLCDDAGRVSDALVEPGNPFDRALTYRKQLNNLLAFGGLPPYDGPDFACTGSAHTGRGVHVRCTNPRHAAPVGAITEGEE